MAQEKTLIEKLRETREGYAEELEWHRFLIDCYTGKGGFAGRISAPETSFLGWAAEVYGNDALSLYGRAAVSGATYLDRHPREDQPKFNRRRDVAHYSNYAEAILDTLTSYVTKRPVSRNGEPKGLTAWRANADGGGTDWSTLLHDVMVPRAALLGWCPMMFDVPALPEALPGKVLTRADTNALGIVPKAIPLFPGHLLDFGVDVSGKLEWAKVRLNRFNASSVTSCGLVRRSTCTRSRSRTVPKRSRLVRSRRRMASARCRSLVGATSRTLSIRCWARA